MKVLQHLLVLSLTLPTLALGEPGTVSTITVALVLSSSKPGTVLKYEDGKAAGKPVPKADGGGPVYGNTWNIIKENKDGEILSDEFREENVSKIGVYKYSNREVLKDLVDQGILDKKGAAPHIAGWSIVRVTDASSVDAPIYARHTDKTMVDISEHITWELLGEPAANENYQLAQKNTYNLTNPDKDKYTETETHTKTYKARASFAIGDSVQGTGIFTGGEKLTFLVYKEFDETVRTPLYIPTASKLAGISGSGEYVEMVDEEEISIPALVEGAISISAGKAVVDLDGYISPE